MQRAKRVCVVTAIVGLSLLLWIAGCGGGGGGPSGGGSTANLPYVNQILSTGQSLSEGANGAPALSTSQPFDNVMLNRVGTAGLYPDPTDLVELNVESPSSGMANFLAQQTGQVFAVSRHGVSGMCYDGLRKGSTSGVYAYDHGMRQMQAVQSWAQKSYKQYRVVAVTAIHGECDEKEGHGAAYKGYLEQWQHDYETDIKAQTGQAGTVPLFIDQMSSFTRYGRTTPAVAIAQLQAAKANPGKIILVGPKYFLPSSDGVHLTNQGYRWLGEYYGKVIKKVAFDHETWQPLMPEKISRQDRVITIKFHVPVPPLRLDTRLVMRRENYGFEYSDASAKPPSIQDVTVAANDTVQLTLSAAPTASGGRVRYAFSGQVGAKAGPQSTGSAHGNLRDSDNTRTASGDTLYNWAVHFDEPVL